MRIKLWAVALALVVFAATSSAFAAGTACGTVSTINGYSWLTTTVASATTPACIMPPGDRQAFTCRARAANSTTLTVWPYTGTVPSAVDANSNMVEVSAKDIFEDSFSSGGPPTSGIAAVSTSGSSDIIDCWWR